MEAIYTVLLAASAFCLGACPFSVWIGKWLLDKDIRDYGDGNPGATNVFRAGGRKSGFLAVILEVAKGIPFVVLAYSYYGLPKIAVVAIALCAILGHAFSPILRLKGGKSLAVTFGVLLALPQHDMFIIFTIFIFWGFLFIESDAWTVIFSTAGLLIYVVISRGSSWETLLLLCVLVILVIKNFNDLHTIPRYSLRPICWLRSKKTANPNR